MNLVRGMETRNNHFSMFPNEAMEVNHCICHADYGFPFLSNDLLVNCEAGTLDKWLSEQVTEAT